MDFRARGGPGAAETRQTWRARECWVAQRIELEGEIPADWAGKRADQALAGLLPSHSRSRLAAWMREGKVQLDGNPVRPRDPVRGGEQFRVVAELEDGDSQHAEDIPLDIIYQDEHLLVINKPPGLVVHPGAGNRSGTLMNALLHHVPGLGALPRAGIVHRLDKLTSGLLVIAATLEAHTALVRAMAEREIQREYLAIVNGVLTAGGTVDQPMGRHRVDRKRMAVTESGRDAVTHYRVVEKFAAHTLVRAKLETGRTHQIRVHMQYLRHPLVGDKVYGGRPRLPRGASEVLRNALQTFPRQALHAEKLVFLHPVSSQQLEFQAAMPTDMRDLVDVLRSEVVVPT